MATTNLDWITVDKGNGSNSSSVSVVASENTDQKPRSGEIVIRSESGKEINISITQNGAKAFRVVSKYSAIGGWYSDGYTGTVWYDISGISTSSRSGTVRISVGDDSHDISDTYTNFKLTYVKHSTGSESTVDIDSAILSYGTYTVTDVEDGKLTITFSIEQETGEEVTHPSRCVLDFTFTNARSATITDTVDLTNE